MENNTFNYYLISGEIVFKDKKEEQFHRYPINGLIKGSSDKITVRHLANAQKVLQINFHQSTKNDPNLEVVDCIIHGISFLGNMSDEEFQDVKFEEAAEPKAVEEQK